MNTNSKRPAYLIVGACLSCALLALFFFLQSREGELLELPVRFLLFSLVPVAFGFGAGGFGRVEIPKVITISAELEDKLRRELKEEPSAGRVPITQPEISLEAVKAPGAPIAVFGDWRDERAKEHQRTSGYMLAHVYKRSTQKGQRFEVFIFIARHTKGSSLPPQTDKFSEIEKAEFFFGDSWGNRVFEVPASEGAIGVRTHAWGTFLASCRITFKAESKEPVVIFRYIDFFMGPQS